MQADDRIRFAERIENLKELAELQGRCISEEQIDEVFSGLDLSQEQKELINDYLKRERIGIGEVPDKDEFCTEQELTYLSLYLKELEELPMYSDGEKEVYYRAAMNQDKDAIAKVIEIFLPKIPDIAKLYAGWGISLEELICEGNVALTVAAGMLDSQESIEDVDELLAQMVMNSMQELVDQEKKQSDADENVLGKINRVMEAAKELYDCFLRKATMEEVAKESGYSLKTIKEIDMLTAGAIEYMESEFLAGKETDTSEGTS